MAPMVLDSTLARDARAQRLERPIPELNGVAVGLSIADIPETADASLHGRIGIYDAQVARDTYSR
jgi:hypothetical protein